jgi:hypothetical protein
VKLPSVGLWLNASKSESILESDDVYLFQCEGDIEIEAAGSLRGVVCVALSIIAGGQVRLEDPTNPLGDFPSSSRIAISNIGRDKSIADDFDFETGDCKQ